MNQTNLRLAFAGTPELAAKVLESIILAGEHSVEAVLTQPDRPAGRGRKLRQSDVKCLALEHKLTVYQPEKSSDLKLSYLDGCDLMLVVAYGLLIPPAVLAKPKLGCINIHTSLLPRWRGAAPIQRAIEAGDQETGITFMQMDQGLDTGPILKQFPCPIDAKETGGVLHDRLAKISADNINPFLSEIAIGSIKTTKQDESKSTYANKISKQEAKIDWTRSAVELERKVRAFNPYPVTHTQINDTNMRIWEAVVNSSTESKTPGSILKNKNSLDVVTGDGILSITKLQLPGKKLMTAKDFFNGHPDFFDNHPVAI